MVGTDLLIIGTSLLSLGLCLTYYFVLRGRREARDLVRAMRYPPQGIRGSGAALARAGHDVRAMDLAVETFDPELVGWADAVAMSVPMPDWLAQTRTYSPP